MSAGFQKDVHIFRAIAILFIVGGHTRFTMDWTENARLGAYLADFLANGTVLFVFASGYLFQALFARFQYRRYLLTKLRNVVLPYLLVSIPAVLFAVFYLDPADRYPQLESYSKLAQIGWFYIKGGAHMNYPLWFIPMISMFFLMAPAFAVIIRNPILYWVLLPLCFVSAFIHRAPFPHLDTLHLFLYFLAPYIAGMCVSQYRAKIDSKVEGRLPHLTVIYAVILISHFALAESHGVHVATDWFSAENGLFDWPFLQKMILALWLLEFGRKYQDLLFGKLKYIADTSFGIYFVHVYFLVLYQAVFPEAFLNASLISFLLWFFVVTASSVLACFLTQKLLGSRSRYLIGC
jgi:peptidoglycan/LPS O-acetylase OafA/YrhL